MTSVKPERIFQFVEPFTRCLIPTVKQPPICLQERRGA
jgi:hypothetical protein